MEMNVIMTHMVLVEM